MKSGRMLKIWIVFVWLMVIFAPRFSDAFVNKYSESNTPKISPLPAIFDDGIEIPFTNYVVSSTTLPLFSSTSTRTHARPPASSSAPAHTAVASSSPSLSSSSSASSLSPRKLFKPGAFKKVLFDAQDSLEYTSKQILQQIENAYEFNRDAIKELKGQISYLQYRSKIDIVTPYETVAYTYKDLGTKVAGIWTKVIDQNMQVASTIVAVQASGVKETKNIFKSTFDRVVDKGADILFPLFYNPNDYVANIVNVQRSTTTSQTSASTTKNVTKTTQSEVITTPALQRQTSSVNTNSVMGLLQSLITRISALENLSNSPLSQIVNNYYTNTYSERAVNAIADSVGRINVSGNDSLRSELLTNANLLNTNIFEYITTTSSSSTSTFAGPISASVFYGDGSQLTGISVGSSFSTSSVREVLSSSATPLSYDNSTGVFSITSGYSIPLTASTTAWESKVGSQWITSGSDISYSTGNVGIGTANPQSKLYVDGNIQSSTGVFRGDDQWHQIILHNGGNNSDYYEWGDTLANGGGHRFYVDGNSWTLGMQVATDGTYIRGNVGIGTTTPSAKLAITGSGTGTGQAFAIADSSNSPKFTVLDNGNVGIGTTNPTTKLSILGTTTISQTVDNGAFYGLNIVNKTTQNTNNGQASAGIQFSNDYYSNPIGYITGSQSNYNDSSKPYLGFYIGTGSNAPSQRFSIGNDAIGSSVPIVYNSGLGVSGYTAANSPDAFEIQGMGNTAGTLSSYGWSISQYSYGPAITARAVGGASGADLLLQVASDSFTRTTAMTLLSGGNVGIGTTTPSAKLAVNGDAYIAGNLSATGTVSFTGSVNPFTIVTGTNGATGLTINSNAGVRLKISESTIQDEAGWIGNTPFIHLTGNTAGVQITASGGSGIVAFNTGGSNERMRIGADGSIGIGTTTPSAKLAITGTAGTGDIFAIASSTESNLFVVKSSGNVGIGTSAPTVALDVVGAANFTGDISTGANIFLNNSWTTAIKAAGGPSLALQSNYINFQWPSNPVNSVTIDTPQRRLGINNGSPSASLDIVGNGGANILSVASSTGDSLLFIGANGNVGIGTASPDAKITIAGFDSGENYFALSNQTYPGRELVMNSSGGAFSIVTNPWALTLDTGSNNLTLKGNTQLYNGSLTFLTNGGGSNTFGINNAGDNVLFSSSNGSGFNIMSMNTNNGNVGISTTTPSAKLAITGSGTGTGQVFAIADSSNSPKFTVLDNGNVGIGTASPSTLLNVSDGTQSIFSVDKVTSNGTFTMTAASPHG